jgi:glycosyltransferase involved in cell wall biosynthesis
MGLMQKLDTVLEAARICAATAPDVQFVFVGGGVDKARLEQHAAKLQLPNVRFLPRQPMQAIGGILSLADALLVHLRDDPLFRITIPSKTQAYLAMGRPILMAVAGDAARLVEQSGGGLTCPPEDPVALAEAVGRLRATPRPERDAMGRKGRAFYDRHLSSAVGVEKFERVFEDTVQKSRVKHGGNRHGSPRSPGPVPDADRAREPLLGQQRRAA